ncbi:MAG: hypothetical protein HQL99_03030, partial [Magnetococcales bacterium]|nr:hypothetical protein [Magnetococcales bacterium]
MAEDTGTQNATPVADDEEESRQTLDDLTVLQNTRTADLSAESSQFTEQTSSSEDLQALGSIQMGSGAYVEEGTTETQTTESAYPEEETPIDATTGASGTASTSSPSGETTEEGFTDAGAEIPTFDDLSMDAGTESAVIDLENLVTPTTPTTATTPTTPTTATTPTTPTFVDTGVPINPLTPPVTATSATTPTTVTS